MSTYIFNSKFGQTTIINLFNFWPNLLYFCASNRCNYFVIGHIVPYGPPLLFLTSIWAKSIVRINPRYHDTTAGCAMDQCMYFQLQQPDLLNYMDHFNPTHVPMWIHRNNPYLFEYFYGIHKVSNTQNIQSTLFMPCH